MHRYRPRPSIKQPTLLANKRLVVQQMQCARYTYLPVILPEIRDNFVKSVLAPDELESLASPTEDWWFEVNSSRDGEDAHGNGEICKWYVKSQAVFAVSPRFKVLHLIDRVP